MTYTYEWEGAPYDVSQEQLIVRRLQSDGMLEGSRRVGFVTHKLIPNMYEARTVKTQDIQMFKSKKDAKAWVLAMVRLTN